LSTVEVLSAPSGDGGDLEAAEPDGAVGLHLDAQVVVVDEVVVVAAERDEVVEVGTPALLPGPEVVDLAPGEVHVAAPHRAGGCRAWRARRCS
jgi:hypothetical protein